MPNYMNALNPLYPSLFDLIDPHFKTWCGDFFSYHGECDLVLVKNPQFRDTLGLLIHVRTKMEKHWSYVKNAAIKIGNDVVEIEGRGKVWDKSAESVYFINGMMNTTLPFSISGMFPLTHVQGKTCNKEGSNCIEAAVYNIDLKNGESIHVTQKWGVLHVSVSAKGNTTFGNSVGIMGHFNKPGLLARDGIRKITDPNLFGQEWQVLSIEPKLFQEQRAPIHPDQCVLPEVSRRRLGENSTLYQIAKEACAEVEKSSKEFCIFDVTAVGMAEAAAIYYSAREE